MIIGALEVSNADKTVLECFVRFCRRKRATTLSIFVLSLPASNFLENANKLILNACSIFQFLSLLFIILLSLSVTGLQPEV